MVFVVTPTNDLILFAGDVRVDILDEGTTAKTASLVNKDYRWYSSTDAIVIGESLHILRHDIEVYDLSVES